MATSRLQTAVVTGASDGIGAAIVEALLQTKVWRVCLVARSEPKMNAILQGCGVSDANNAGHKIISVDLSNPQNGATLADEINQWCGGRLNLLVNNAGNVGRGNLKTLTLSEWTYTLNLHVTMALLLTQQLAFSLKNAQGSVVNVGSMYGTSMIIPDSTAYCVAKAALAQLTKLNAFELAEDKVRVNCVQPGYVWTKIMRHVGEAERAQFYTDIAPKITPLKRIGTTNDVVNLILFLADNNKSSWMTGQCITIDGGTSMINGAYPAFKVETPSKL